MIKNRLIKGFTLVELLIVIAIIGIIVAFSAIGFQGSFEKSRDTQRKSDLKQFQSSLESYANSHNSLYPGRTTTAQGDQLCTDLGLTGCPSDPKNGSGCAAASAYTYCYQSNGDATGTATATSYVLWTRLESPTTVTNWVACSNGKSGTLTSGIPPLTPGTCPLP